MPNTACTLTPLLAHPSIHPPICPSLKISANSGLGTTPNGPSRHCSSLLPPATTFSIVETPGHGFPAILASSHSSERQTVPPHPSIHTHTPDLSVPNIFIMIPTVSPSLDRSPSLSASPDILPPFVYLGLNTCLFSFHPCSVLSASFQLLVLSHPLSAALSTSSLVSAPLSCFTHWEGY